MLPAEILQRVSRRRGVMRSLKLEGPEVAVRGIYSSVYVWPRMDRLNVCFMKDKGSAEQRRQVVKVASAWTLKDGTFELAVQVPPNTKAKVRLPKATLAAVTEGGKPLAAGNGVAMPKQSGDAVTVDVASGQYRFSYTWGGR